MATKRQVEAEKKHVKAVQEAIKAHGFISLAEASERSEISLKTLSTAVKDGRLPAVILPRRGALVRWRAVELRIGLPGSGNAQATKGSAAATDNGAAATKKAKAKRKTKAKAKAKA